LRVDLIKFRAKHLLEIDPKVTPSMLEAGEIAQEYGTAFTAVLCGDPIGAAGIAVIRPGHGEAWSLLSPMIKRLPVMLHKAASRLIPEVMTKHGLRRVQVTVNPEDPIAIRWAERLGFEREGKMRNFGDNGEDVLLYSMIRREVNPL
jgi:hypothetical protein